MSKQGYEVTMHENRLGYGAEWDIAVPDNGHPVIVTQDVFGEKEARMQILVYAADAGAGDTGNVASVRINPDGSIAEVVVPEDVPVRRWDELGASDWMVARDGK